MSVEDPSPHLYDLVGSVCILLIIDTLKLLPTIYVTMAYLLFFDNTDKEDIMYTQLLHIKISLYRSITNNSI